MAFLPEGIRKALSERSEKLKAAGLGITDDLTFGLDDEISGAYQAVSSGFQGKDMGEAYQKGKARYQEAKKEALAKEPMTYQGAGLATGLLTPALAAAKGAKGVKAVLDGAKIGGLTGSLRGLGDSEGEDRAKLAKDILSRGASGALMGASLAGVGQGISKMGMGDVVDMSSRRKGPPTPSGLRKAPEDELRPVTSIRTKAQDFIDNFPIVDGKLGHKLEPEADPFRWSRAEDVKTFLDTKINEPMEIFTRSDLIAHDDIVERLGSKHKVNILMPVSNVRVARLIEPSSPSIQRRIKAANKLFEDGVPVTIQYSKLEGEGLPRVMMESLLEFRRNMRDMGLNPKIKISTAPEKVDEKKAEFLRKILGNDL